ncbi:MAG TPA: CAP domain-containing protein [Drouetiella sp.]
MRTGSQNRLRRSMAFALALSCAFSLHPAYADSWTPGETGKQTAATDAAEFTPVHSNFDPSTVSNPANSARPGPFQGGMGTTAAADTGGFGRDLSHDPPATNQTGASPDSKSTVAPSNKLDSKTSTAPATGKADTAAKTDSKTSTAPATGKGDTASKTDSKTSTTSAAGKADTSAKVDSKTTAASKSSKADPNSKKAMDFLAPPQKAQTAPVPSKDAGATGTTNAGGSTANGAQSPAGNSGMSPNSVPGNGANPTANTGSTPGPFQGSQPPGADNYPSVGRMERLTFGSAAAESPIEDRLNKLETAIFKKSYGEMSLFDRTQQLKKTLLGGDDEPTADIDNLRIPGIPNWNNLLNSDPLATQSSSEFDYFGGLAQRPENQQTTTIDDMKAFALELINTERAKSGLTPLVADPIAEKMAKDQSQELSQRGIISHANAKGENPDRRYTLSGGTGALTESIVSNKLESTFAKSPTRAAVAELMKNIMNRQDDRDAILNPDATNIGLDINYTANKDRVIEVAEVVTAHGIIPELPNEVPLGEKLEIKGVIAQPYQFDRITVAWEANRALSSNADDADEALPYFPPLDYVAYAQKSSKDYSGAMTALRAAGVIAAIAGGVFVPPVALAAPVIAMSGSMGSGDPKPISDIPIHGGVKVEGLTFDGRVPINKEGKEGIYYVTIWGSTGKMTKPIPISRRAIIAKHVDEDVSARIEPSTSSSGTDTQDSKDKSDKKAKHHKNK